MPEIDNLWCDKVALIVDDSQWLDGRCQLLLTTAGYPALANA
jgi:hypothetical protein